MAQETLLSYLQKQGVIKEADAIKVQVERSRSPKNEETIIREMKLADDESITKAKSAIFNIPYVDLMENDVPESIIAEIPIDSLKKYRAVPF